MRSNIGSMNNVKIFVLYLMKNINYPMDFVAVNDVVMQTDYVAYLDFAEAFHKMLEDGLICENGVNERGEKLYSVTSKGSLVADALKSDLLPSVLDQSLTYALRYLDFQRRGVVSHSHAEKLPDQTFDVTVSLTEKGKTLLKVTINTDSEYHARQMKETFFDRPDAVYRGVLGLLSGNVKFLYDDKK